MKRENLSSMSHSLIYVTAPSEDVATQIASCLLEDKRIACANILPSMKSLYWWKGEIQKDTEVVLILKTVTSQFDSIAKKINKLHPYKCPCIVALPIDKGHSPFLQWIDQQVGASPHSHK